MSTSKITSIALKPGAQTVYARSQPGQMFKIDFPTDQEVTITAVQAIPPATGRIQTVTVKKATQVLKITSPAGIEYAIAWDGGLANVGGTIMVTPAAPSLTADDNANTLSATHPLGVSEIVLSTNDAASLAYNGSVIAVGDNNRAAGYYKFKIKAAAGRNESAVASSPAFTMITPQGLPVENGDYPSPAIANADIATLTLAPDFERRASVSISGVQVTSSKPFVTADIGKVIVLKAARSVDTYRQAPMAFTGFIGAVVGGKAVVASGTYGNAIDGLIDASGVECLTGTNQFDAIQAAITAANAGGKKALKLNWTGTVYAVPALSNYANGQGNQYKGFYSSTSLVLVGNGQNSTIVKFGMEDNIDVPGGANYMRYNGINYSGAVELRDIQLQAADRTSLNTASYISFAQGIGPNRSLRLRRASITSPDYYSPWHDGIVETNTITAGTGVDGDKLNIILQQSRLEAGCPVTIYSQNGAVKRYVVRQSYLVGGGQPCFKTPYVGGVSISNDGNGANLLSIASPDFSFYDWRSFDPDWDLKPVVFLTKPSEGTQPIVYTAEQYGFGYTSVHLSDNYDFTAGQAHSIRFTLDPAANAQSRCIDAATGKQLIFHANTDDSRPAEINYVIGAGTPVIVKLSSDGTQYEVFANTPVYVQQIINGHTARVSLSKSADVYIPGNQVNSFADGTAILQTRPQAAAEGHVHYIHPNVELDIDGMYISKYLKLISHYYSSGGVAGTHNVIKWKNLTIEPYDEPRLAGGIIPAQVQLQNEGNFTGTAFLGQSVVGYNYEIGVPFTIVPDDGLM